MDPRKNWWELTACGARYLAETAAALSAGRSVALIGSPLPWPDTFYEKLKGANLSASKTFEKINGGQIKRPAEFLFNQYCPADERASYWPEPPQYTHVNFLAETEKAVINNRFVVVRGFSNEQTFICWCEFAEKYARCVREAGVPPERRAVFVLEYPCGEGVASRMNEVRALPFRPRKVDVFTYDLVNTAAVYDNYRLNLYAAELVGAFCGGDIELGGKLSERGGLAEDPAGAYRAFAPELPEALRMTPEQLDSAVITAQFKVFFPVIEQKRTEMIRKYYDRIKRILPWTTDHNEERTEPYDMELRDIIYKFSQIGVSEPDRHTVNCFRDARNQIAHNHVLPFRDLLPLLD